MSEQRIRTATEADIPDILRLVRALAVYEHEPAETVRMSEADLRRYGFGPHPYFEVLLADNDGRAVGFALFFHNFSTWQGRPGIYVEDLFVEEPARGLGLGRRLIAEIARIAKARDCRRIDLWVLRWNPTRDFYHRIGLNHMEEWLPYRMEEDAIAAMAAAVD